VPLGQRRRADQKAQVAEPAPSPARHCLVDGRPGLLTEWRREPDGTWSGRVVRVEWVDGEGWCTVAGWVRADRIIRGSEP